MPGPDPNAYAYNQLVRLRAQFVDPATTTRLLAQVNAGVSALTVESGIIGQGFATGASLVVEGAVLTVAAPGGSASVIPLAAPSAIPHPPGVAVALLVDPTAVTFRVQDPLGAVTVYTAAVVKDGVGNYHLDVTPARHGTWFYRAEGTGVYAATSEGSFTVKPSKFGG